MTSKEKTLSPFLKGYKTISGIIVPTLSALAVICGILACFKSAEGSNSRMIAIAILVGSVLAILLMKAVNKYFEKKDSVYLSWKSKLLEKMQPSVVIPLLIMTVVVAFPFYILAVTSIKTPIEASNLVFTWWPKEGIDVKSYGELFTYDELIGVSMIRAIWNSFVYAFGPTILGLFTAALSAYAFSKLKFRGRDAMYQALIATMMMPGCVTMSTAYIMYDKYGWTNSPMPLIIPAFFGGATIVMFLREYFMGIPDGILEAARIDGAGKWKAFLLIMLPLARPALIAQFVLSFISKYNDYMGPLIYLNSAKDYTIQIALDFLNAATIDKSLVATAGVFSIVPMLALYIIFQKTIIDGISMSSGLKG